MRLIDLVNAVYESELPEHTTEAKIRQVKALCQLADTYAASSIAPKIMFNDFDQLFGGFELQTGDVLVMTEDDFRQIKAVLGARHEKIKRAAGLLKDEIDDVLKAAHERFREMIEKKVNELNE